MVVNFPPASGVEYRGINSFRHACASFAEQDGHWLEFGVWEGGSTRILADYKQPVYGFDSFKGLPEPWHIHPAGYFSTGGKAPDIPGAIFVTGLFQDTLPCWLAENPGKVSLLHIDCDLYSSAVYVLRTLREAGRLVVGTVVMFDEYGLTDDEQRACSEQLAPYFHGEPLYSCGYRDSFTLAAL